MKTKLFLLFLIFICAMSCRRPGFPKPGEPTIEALQTEKPVMYLPWNVMKSKQRLA
ncbi:MAG: hypothetical protein EPGJADBJ_02420 [Saprospiraceae bacterium]|nr:hypothetical protein [Saprospiraceae bacterium]